jgi:ferredoxin-fold anticodon binding domain-containing protein
MILQVRMIFQWVIILHYEGTSFYNDDFSVTFKIKQYE